MSLRPPDSLRVLLTWPEPAASDFRRELQALRPLVDVTPIPAAMLADYLQEAGYYHVLHVTPDHWRSLPSKQRARLATRVHLVVLGPGSASASDLDGVASGLYIPAMLTEAEGASLILAFHRGLAQGMDVAGIIAASRDQLALAGVAPVWTRPEDSPAAGAAASGPPVSGHQIRVDNATGGAVAVSTKGKAINVPEGGSYVENSAATSASGIAIGTVVVQGDMVSGGKVEYHTHGDQVNIKRGSAAPGQLAQRASGDQVNVNRPASALVAPICAKCGQPARPGDRFCQRCGTPLDENAEVTTQSGTPLSPADSILIATVTKVEAQAVLETFAQSEGRALKRRPIENNTYYDLGIIGGVPVFMVQSEMGIATPGGALLTIRQAIQDLRPQAVIMCGLAFGLRPDKQKFGDILVAKQIKYYEPQKVDPVHGQISRGDRAASAERLLDRFRSGDNDWQGAQTHFGLILSGEKLVNVSGFRDSLLEAEPEAIGGEMEGAGLYAAARNAKVDWILVKAVCDWADGNKNDDAQPRAARNAAAFVLHVLQLGGWGGPNQTQSDLS